MSPSDVVRWIVALAILAFGLLSHDPESNTRWRVLGWVLYGLPLVAQGIPRTWVRVYGLYAGLFVVAQALLSPHVAPHTYIVRPAHLNLVVDVVGDNLHGISGPQRLTSDARGFRTTRSVDYGDDAPYRIFFVGASTVAQEWIDDHRTFSHLLQESLSEALDLEVESVNTAVQGTRAIHFLTTMRRVAHLHPDLYVVVPGANDWGLQIVRHYDANTPEQFAHTAVHVGGPQSNRFESLVPLRRYTLEHSLLGRVIHRVWTLAKALLPGRAASQAGPSVQFDPTAAFYAEHRGSLFRADRRTFMPDSVSPDYAETLHEIARLCRDSAARCVFVTHPHSFKPGIRREYMERFWMTPPFEEYTLSFESMAHVAAMYNRFTFRVAEEAGIPVCDLEAEMAPSLDNFYDEMHFNLAGSGRAAEALHPCLLEVIVASTSPRPQ